jgi:hypothetical protein
MGNTNRIGMIRDDSRDPPLPVQSQHRRRYAIPVIDLASARRRATDAAGARSNNRGKLNHAKTPAVPIRNIDQRAADRQVTTAASMCRRTLLCCHRTPGETPSAERHGRPGQKPAQPLAPAAASPHLSKL